MCFEANLNQLTIYPHPLSTPRLPIWNEPKNERRWGKRSADLRRVAGCPKDPFVCPKEGISPIILWPGDGIGTPKNPIRPGEVSGFLGTKKKQPPKLLEVFRIFRCFFLRISVFVDLDASRLMDFFFVGIPRSGAESALTRLLESQGFLSPGKSARSCHHDRLPLLLPRSTLSSSSSESVLRLELGSCQKQPLGILDSILLLWMQISIWNAKALLFILVGHSHEKHIIYNMIWYVMHVDTHSPHNNRFTVSYQGLWCTCSTSRRFRSRLGAHAASRVPETFPTPKKNKTAWLSWLWMFRGQIHFDWVFFSKSVS